MVFPTFFNLSVNLAIRSSWSEPKNEHHNHRKLTKLITWITALSSSMKLWAMPCRATQDGRVTVESSDKTWSTEEELGNHFNIFALRTPWTVWKGKKIGHWKMNHPSWYVSNMLQEKSGETAAERMKRLSQSKNNTHLWVWLVVEVKSDAVKKTLHRNLEC